MQGLEGLFVKSTNAQSFVPDAIVNRTVEPIKREEDVLAIAQWFVDNQKWRDHMLFVVGVNAGLRVSDLLRLRFCHFIDEDYQWREYVELEEKKTAKRRVVGVNEAMRQAITMYLQQTKREISLNDYLFISESNNSKTNDKPLARYSVDRIIKNVVRELHLDYKVGTHTLRKTFGYHQLAKSDNDPRKLFLLQKMFKHNSMRETMCYIGLTDEEIMDAYCSFNLGEISKEWN